jgi:hypothetical protein
MSPYLEKRLLTKYAPLFDGRRGGTRHVGVGDGWYTLLDTLCALICWEHRPDRSPWETKRRRHGNAIYQEADTDDAVGRTREDFTWSEYVVTLPVVHEVKEKLGALRFYANGCNEVVCSYVMFAECLSARICEVCGAPGERRDDHGWLRTLCDRHFAEERETDR